MSQFTTKPISCRKCEYKTLLVTKVDDEGLASHRGWGELRDHINKEHPDYAKALDAWIYEGTSFKLPYETIEREAAKAEARCGTTDSAGVAA